MWNLNSPVLDQEMERLTFWVLFQLPFLMILEYFQLLKLYFRLLGGMHEFWYQRLFQTSRKRSCLQCPRWVICTEKLLIITYKHVLCHALLTPLSIGYIQEGVDWLKSLACLVSSSQGLPGYILSVVELFSSLVLLLALCQIIGLSMLTNSHRNLLLCLNLLYVCWSRWWTDEKLSMSLLGSLIRNMAWHHEKC